MYHVSVIVAAYNARQFISGSIKSVTAQTLRDWELIIVDDDSQDGTAEFVAEQYGHLPNVRCVRLPHNRGPAAARNAGIAVAQGRWLAILDSDDRLQPDRLERWVSIGDQHALDLVTDNQLYFDNATGRIFQKALKLPGEHVVLSPSLLLQNDGPPLRFSFGSLKPLIRHEFWKQHAMHYPEELRIGEDFALLFELLRRGARAWLMGDALYVYTVPHVRGRGASEQSRTNYGQGNIEALLAVNDRLASSAVADAATAHLGPFFRRRHERLACALALRDATGKSWMSRAMRLARQRGGARFMLQKARNVFQRHHVVRGA